MAGLIGRAPGAGDVEAMARAALAGLPPSFAAAAADLVLIVEEFADDETLQALGIDDPLELTGVYEGVPLHDKSIAASGALPDRIRLFRRAILDEWVAGGEDLEHLVAHVVIHEVGHHFGLSDEAMHALEDED
jgi:predicted Zn-dependent protease with MMP-like domain